MRLKLDENLGGKIAQLLGDAGHDLATVREQGLGGVPDETLYERCRMEGRCLVTLDLLHHRCELLSKGDEQDADGLAVRAASCCDA